MIKILYVDDELINLELFEMTFRKEFQIFKSLSANAALDLLKQNKIDVVVSDLKMPGMDGIQFLREVKKQYSKMNCILLTGYYEPKLEEDPEIQSLLYKYVLKPFKKDEMRLLLNSAVIQNNI